MPTIPNSQYEYQDTVDDNPHIRLYVADEIKITGIQTFGWQHAKHCDNADIPLHFHRDCFEFHYLIQGSLSFVVDGEEYLLKDGDVFVTFPNELHQSGTQSRMIRKMFWFSVKEGASLLDLPSRWSEPLMNGLRHLKNRVIPVGSGMKELLKGVFETISSPQTDKQCFASLQMALFLYKLIEYDRLLMERKVSKEIACALTFIEQNKRRNISLEEVAEACHLSLSHFKSRFKAETGSTPALYIQKKRIDCAKELLQEGYSVTETAHRLDFCSSNYFSTVFHRIAQVTPTQYRDAKRIKNSPDHVK